MEEPLRYASGEQGSSLVGGAGAGGGESGKQAKKGAMSSCRKALRRGFPAPGNKATSARKWLQLTE